MNTDDGWKHRDVLPTTLGLAFIGCPLPLLAQVAMMSAKPLASGAGHVATGIGGWRKRRAEAKAKRKADQEYQEYLKRLAQEHAEREAAEAARIAALPPPMTVDELIDELNRRYDEHRARLEASRMDDVTKGMALAELQKVYDDAMAHLCDIR
jgi:hypothetical protein